MDLDFARDELAFQEEVRSWLSDHVPTEPRPHGDGPDSREFDLAWHLPKIHGAMGFTSEARPHRYVHRAHVSGGVSGRARCCSTASSVETERTGRDRS